MLRLIIPSQDRERDAYGIKVVTLGKIYVRILGVDSKSDAAKSLTANSSSKEYPNVVYAVMKNRCSDVGKLTVFEVNKHLDDIASCYKNNERKSKLTILVIFVSLDPNLIHTRTQTQNNMIICSGSHSICR